MASITDWYWLDSMPVCIVGTAFEATPDKKPPSFREIAKQRKKELADKAFADRLGKVLAGVRLRKMIRP